MTFRRVSNEASSVEMNNQASRLLVVLVVVENEREGVFKEYLLLKNLKICHFPPPTPQHLDFPIVEQMTSHGAESVFQTVCEK